MTAAFDGKPVLELRGIRKTYGHHVAVENVDLALGREEFVTFLGPSGSGKTTTLMMVAGLQQPDGGSIRLDGAPIEGQPPYRRDIGMVFQHYALFPHMSVRKNVAFPLEMRGLGKAEIQRQVTDALELVGLAEYGQRLPRQLSGGQQQRVALARAMVYRPALLLMDEPLGALDKKLREQMQREIKRLHRERRIAVLYVTHDQEEALTMSDRIAVFNHGRIEQIGTPSELYERPASRFVADFLGDTNFFSGRIANVAGDRCLVSLGEHRVEAMLSDGLAAGAEVVVAVRPERMRLLAAGAGGIEGRLTDVIYLGAARRSVVRLADGEYFATQPPNEAGAPGPAIGEAVGLAWDPRHAIVFAR
ncbi:polyamine-transporting ATPase [Aliidongia dinghuensis]|uniref:Spermidine/putrescine import ATP-binding protein PotA n=1 Tax=Aliidongia dinghuensis TaxID=1867774 RepID=A0A8J2YY56_9PROT|nr:ABC transporter ATP-binding protein [Aliidongia dinghuensis]GGF39561.1 polyamine-transporting ATPase [Aliidongia dinghuensis]